MKYSRVIILMLFIFQGFFGSTQSPPAVLKSGDVDKFINTLKPMSKELEAIGISVDSNSTPEAMMANAKVMAVLNKYGWDASMWVKWSSIAMCYGKLKMDEQMAALPAEQREQMKQMMKMAGQQMDEMINPEDLKLVKAKMSQLDAVMQEE